MCMVGVEFMSTSKGIEGHSVCGGGAVAEKGPGEDTSADSLSG